MERSSWHLSLQHPKLSLCREVWEQLGGAGQRQICSFISMFRKSHSWKRNSASFLLPPNCQLCVIGEWLAWVCTSASTFWLCILSIQRGCRDAVVSHARGEWHMLRYPHLHHVGLPSTAPTQGKFEAEDPNNIHWL